MGFLSSLFGISKPKPPPPPPTPATLASPGPTESALQAERAAAAGAGQGWDNTLKTGPQGAPAPQTAEKELLGG